MAASVNIKNADGVEERWMKEEAPRADEYLQHLVQLGSKRMRVTGLDREEGLDSEMHKSFRRFFSDMDVRTLDPNNPFNASDDYNGWIPMLGRWMRRLWDSKMLTMLRIDCTRGYTSDNIWLVPKIKFYAVECARNHEGHNDAFIRRCRLGNLYPVTRVEGEEGRGGEGADSVSADDGAANSPPTPQSGLRVTRTSRFAVWGVVGQAVTPADQPMPGALAAAAAAAAATADDADSSSTVVDATATGEAAEAAAAAAKAADALVEKEMERIIGEFDDPYGADWGTIKTIKEELRAQVYSAELQKRANDIGVKQQLAAARTPLEYRNAATHAAIGTAATAAAVSERLVARASDVVVVDNVLPKEVLVQAREELNARAIRKDGMQRTFQGAVDTRQDRICWMNEGDGTTSGCPGLEAVVRFLKGIAHELVEIAPKRFDHLRVPQQCMGAVYDAGGFYVPHRDNTPTVGAEGSNDRVVTAILYLCGEDGDWDVAKHGGCLRTYVGGALEDDVGGSAVEVRDVSPQVGRLVLFNSRELLHEVVPTHRQRLAVSIWILGKR